MQEQTKRDGTIRELINLEDKVRKDYGKRWGRLTQPYVNEFYNPNYICDEFRNRWKKDTEKCPFVYDTDRGRGESRFVSKEMYEELVAKCRCGRPKTEVHMLKCLQKVKNEGSETTRANDLNEEGKYGGKFPITSSGVIGWPKHRYQDLERSTYYVSPKYSIPGGRIDDKPYSNIFIG